MAGRIHRASTPRATPSRSSRARASAQPVPRLRAHGQDPAAHPHRRWTRPRRPACCRTASARSSRPSRTACRDIFLLDLETGADEEPHPGRLLRRRPPDLAGRQARRLHAPDQRPRQGVCVPARPPGAEDPAHLRRATTTPPPSSRPTATSIYYSSTEDDDIPNLRSLDLRTGAIRQYTDALGGNMAPAVLPGTRGRARGLHQLLQGRVPAADDRDRRPREGGRPGGADRLRGRDRSTSSRTSPTRWCPRTSARSARSRSCSWRAARRSTSA